MVVSWHQEHILLWMCQKGGVKRMIKCIFLSSPHFSSSRLSSPLHSHLFEKHPLFEACDGKRERLKQSASKLACQKALNQYPSSLPTQPCSPFTPPLPLSVPAVPPFLRLFPSFSLHFLLHSCTLSLLLSCPSLSLSLTLNFPSPSSSKTPCFLRGLTDGEKSFF